MASNTVVATRVTILRDSEQKVTSSARESAIAGEYHISTQAAAERAEGAERDSIPTAVAELNELANSDAFG